MKRLRSTVLLAVLLLFAGCSTQPQAPDTLADALEGDITVLSTTASVIDFELNLRAGDTVSRVDAQKGISGYDAGGFVGVFGRNPDFVGQNAAMTFDATCNGKTASQCSGGDKDLFKPELGNVLIISEDMRSDWPNDRNAPEGTFTFDFESWGSGTVTVGGMVLNVLDVEAAETAGASVKLYADSGNTLLETILIKATGNNGLGTVELLANVSGVARMVVDLKGSGAIDNIHIAADVPQTSVHGCTPGYWKQPHHFDSWVGYAPSNSFATVFGVTASGTLLEALNARGGGENALKRHAVAALLNAANPSVRSNFTQAQIIQMVRDAYTSGSFEALKNTFEALNERGCPLN